MFRLLVGLILLALLGVSAALTVTFIAAFFYVVFWIAVVGMILAVIINVLILPWKSLKPK